MAKGRQTLRDPRSFVASASGIKKVFASATPSTCRPPACPTATLLDIRPPGHRTIDTEQEDVCAGDPS